MTCCLLLRESDSQNLDVGVFRGPLRSKRTFPTSGLLIARSESDEAIELHLAPLDCFAYARNDDSLEAAIRCGCSIAVIVNPS